MAGVYALGYRHVEPVARAMAAVLACGPRAVLSHESAAALYGWRRWPKVPEVSAALERRRPGIRTHRPRSLPRRDVTRQLGVPVTRPERTIREIESRLTRKQFTRMVKDAWLERRLDKTAVTRLLGYPAEPSRSEVEEAFRRFCRRFGLPTAVTLATVHGHEVDALFVAQRLVVELDGWEFHGDQVAFASDRERDADLLDVGYETVRTRGNDCTRPRSGKPRGCGGSWRGASGNSDCEPGSTSGAPPSVEVAASDRQARLAARPRRIPRVAGHILAAQRGVRVVLGDEVAELLEAAVVDARHVGAGGVDVGRAHRRGRHRSRGYRQGVGSQRGVS
jgi:hypothetical protein